MGRQGDITDASRPSRRLILASVAIWLVVALALPLSALTLNFFRLGGSPLGFWIAAQGALIALVVLAFVYAWRAGGRAPAESIWPSFAFAGEAVGAATLVGFTGYIAAIGYDALALPLGLVAGLTLFAILIAPRFVLYPVRSIGGFFAVRYGGNSARRLALLIAAAATAVLLAADLKAGAYALQSVARIEFPEAVTALVFSVAAVWLVGSVLTVRKLAGISFAAMLIGLIITLVAIAARARGWTIPHLTLGAALENHLNLNMTLVVNRLADVDALTPMASPFLQLSMRNFAGLMLAVALGMVAAPHLLGRHVSQSAVAPGGAVRRTALALIGVAVVVASLPPLAVYSRVAFETVLAKGIEDAAIPKKFAEASELGWVKICDRNSRDVADLAAACAKAPEQRGFLRLQDLTFSTDGFVVAAPFMAGLDRFLQYPLLFAVLIATLLMGHALLASLVDADAEVRKNSSLMQRDLDFRSATIGASVLALGAVIASVSTIGSGLLLAEGFALLAAGLFVPIVLGLYWRHMNSAGAVAAMAAGTFIAAVYLLGVHVWPVEFFRISSGLSDAGAEATQRFADLDTAFTLASDPQAQAAAWTALREHAATLANWSGLKPAAIVLVAVPLGFVVAIAVSLLVRGRKTARPAR
jgi:putative solute:sodium symporter small subunit